MGKFIKVLCQIVNMIGQRGNLIEQGRILEQQCPNLIEQGSILIKQMTNLHNDFNSFMLLSALLLYNVNPWNDACSCQFQ